MAERFVVLALPRSGTNYFLSKIAPLDGVLAAWEPFNIRMDRWLDQTTTFCRLPDISKIILTDKQRRDTDPQRFFAEAFATNSDIALPGVSAIGFKLFPQHNYDLFWRMSKDPSMKVIVIDRANRLDSFSSFVTAVNTDRWIGNNDHCKGKIAFDPYYFETYYALAEAVYSGLKNNLISHGVQFIHVDYEQMVSGEKCFVAACDFLSIDYKKIETALKKQINFKAVELFSKKEDVEAYFRKKHPQFI